MKTSRIRLLAISGATMALIVAGTASVAAHPGNRDDRPGLGQGRMSGPGQGYGLPGEAWGGLGGRLGMVADSFVRHETTWQTDDGLVTQRTDNGTVASVATATLEYTLATGETASVSTDDDTEVIAFGEETVEFGRRGFSRQRLMPESIELADISAGSEVVVWAASQADGTFLAQRIVIQPLADEADEANAEAETEVEASEDAAVEAEA